MKQAMAVHEEVVRMSNEFHESLAEKLALTAENIQVAFANGDSALAGQLQRLEAELSALDMRFHDFSETVVEIPGHAHDHGHAHGHDHDHDHGHDHGGVSLEGMSDEAILEIQEALKAQVQSIQAAFDQLQNDSE